MSEKSVSRALLRIGALTTAAVLAFGGATTGALAQEPETPSSSAEPTPTSTATATPTTEPSTSAAPPTPPTPDTKPENKVAAPPLPATANEKLPDLSVRVAPDKPDFLPGEDIGLTLTVTNKGEAPALNIRLGHESTRAWLLSGADELGSRPSLPPGGQKVFRVVLRPSSVTDDAVPFLFRATVDGVADPTPGDNGTNLNIKVRQDKGTASGVLYVDKNGNGRFDDGEGLANASVEITGGAPKTSVSAFTDDKGEFATRSVPTGSYSVRYSGSAGYVVQPGRSDFVVEQNRDTRLDVPLVAPVSNALSASMAFDKPSYTPAEEVGLNVTLTNRGSVPLTGVVAVCTTGTGYLSGTGEGWKALRPDGAGVALAAGETKVVRVTDSVPKNLSFQTFYASCSFGNNGANRDGYAYAGTAYASVHGLFGTVNLHLVNDAKVEPIRGATVAVLDAATRHPLKEVTSGSNGDAWIYDVPAGKAVLVVSGKWQPADGREFTLDVRPDQRNNLDLRLSPSDVEVPAPAADRPDFEVTAKFDKDTYNIAEPMRVNVTVKNVGTGYAHEVYLRTGFVAVGQLDFDQTQFGDLNYDRKVSLWPGESKTITLLGRAPYHLQDGKVWLKLEAVSYEDVNGANNAATASAPVTYLNGDAAVVVYADRNGNKQRDAGEDLPNVNVLVSGGTRPFDAQQGKTDAAGRVAFKNLPVGVFKVWIWGGDEGWVRNELDELTISAGAESVLEIGTVRPLSDKLFATLSFVKHEYAPGENYELDITLENRTGADLPSVKALCYSGDPGDVRNSGPGWGELVSGGAGVPLKNGEKRTWRVSGEQPKDAVSIGYATASCYFAPDTSDRGAAYSHAEFRVPGQRNDALGKLVQGKEQSPVAGAVVVLVDHLSKKIAARTITDETGLFKVTDLPLGRYEIVLEGPWQVDYRRLANQFFLVTAGEPVVQVMLRVPGPEAQDPGYPLPEDQQPGANVPPVRAAAGGGGEALAKTGASVLGLGLVGALLVAFGLGASVIGRRRTA